MTFTAADLGAVVTVWTMVLGLVGYCWFHFWPTKQDRTKDARDLARQKLREVRRNA